MNEVIAQQLMFCKKSGLEVDVNERMGTVAMTTHGEDLAFLQGDEADTFIAGANSIYNDEELNLFFCDACNLMGYPYLDLRE